MLCYYSKVIDKDWSVCFLHSEFTHTLDVGWVPWCIFYISPARTSISVWSSDSHQRTRTHQPAHTILMSLITYPNVALFTAQRLRLYSQLFIYSQLTTESTEARWSEQNGIIQIKRTQIPGPSRAWHFKD